MSGRFTIVGLGEVLWDLFEDGKVLGGAPFNFAYHASCLGHTGIALSRIGQDRLGDEIVVAAEELGVPSEHLQRDPDHPTGTVHVRLDAHGAPDFTIVEDVAWDYMEPDGGWLDVARRCDALCFGTLAQRGPVSGRAIQQVLEAAAGALTVCDINFRQRFYSREVVARSLAAAGVLKLNEREVGLLREVLGVRTSDSADSFLRGLMADCGIQLVCVTLGAEGCRLISADGAVTRPVPPVRVVDTVGSGDAFGAALAVKYLEGRPLGAVAEAANLIGAYVAGCRGATPPPSEAVLAQFQAL